MTKGVMRVRCAGCGDMTPVDHMRRMQVQSYVTSGPFRDQYYVKDYELCTFCAHPDQWEVTLPKLQNDLIVSRAR